jgi:hypothetical protein
MDSDPPRPGIQLYRRLYISQNDLWQAELFAERLAVDPPQEDLLREALTMAAVVSYARPFTPSASTDEAHAMLPKGTRRRAFTAEERALHDRVLFARNTEVAHSDTAVHALAVTLGDTSTMVNYRVHSVFYRWRQPEAAAFLALIRRLREWVSARMAEERTRIPAGHYPPSPRNG